VAVMFVFIWPASGGACGNARRRYRATTPAKTSVKQKRCGQGAAGVPAAATFSSQLMVAEGVHFSRRVNRISKQVSGNGKFLKSGEEISASIRVNS
jgi:hypothetical protein